MTEPTAAATVASTPDVSVQQDVYALIADGVKIVGALGIVVPATLQNGAIEYQIAGFVAVGLTLAMQWMQRRKRAALAHASAVASAKATTPLRATRLN